jgi:feruloyl esterase
VLNRAAIAACDADDGVTDGVIENPRQCRSAEAADCLTAAQVEAAGKFYSPGSEAGWSTMAGPQISPDSTVDYYESAPARMGGADGSVEPGRKASGPTERSHRSDHTSASGRIDAPGA